jgi:hypothetical protein
VYIFWKINDSITWNNNNIFKRHLQRISRYSHFHHRLLTPASQHVFP